jgi:hypothetical protein
MNVLSTMRRQTALTVALAVSMLALGAGCLRRRVTADQDQRRDRGLRRSRRAAGRK